ncbi:MAG: biotin transporter BioY [Gemmatimonadota bacterium]|nr:biotin transporter BioY [Gemmatimonadota bacterium]
MSTFSQTWRSLAAQEVVEDRAARAALGVVAFALATALSAQAAVWLPWTPVPVTLQPLFVILAGALLGARLGAVAIGLYVVVGALGAPVFANGGGGLLWLLGPTGGYLLAAPVAAYVSGAVSGREGRGLRLVAGLTLGIAAMYTGGVAQLLAVSGMSLGAAVAAGVTPFVVGDLTKIGLAFFTVRSVRWASQNRS